MESLSYDNSDLILESASSLVSKEYNFNFNDFEESLRAYHLTLLITEQVTQHKDYIAIPVILPNNTNK
jgi:hypothetical protein